MKRSHSWLLVALLFVVSCGGGDDGAGPGPGPGGNNDLPEPVPTAVGTPNGAPTTETIGAAGGSVASSDGAFTLTIPAGALASDTDITVQPITNTAWGGIGTGYQLTPDGLTFSQPVELVFDVAPENLAGSVPEGIYVATQDDAGFWYLMDGPAFDENEGTISCTTTHFSTYSVISELILEPTSANVNVTGSVTLSIRKCFFQTFAQDPQAIAQVLTCTGLDPDLLALVDATNWSVNGVVGGNNTVGRVNPTSGPQATYTAPAAAPLVNPVAVSVKVRVRRGAAYLVSNISVGSGFTGTINHVDESGNTIVYTMTWESDGALGDIESFTGTGHVVYSLGDPGIDCTNISFDPDNADVDPLQSYMLVNRNGQPFQVTVTVNAHWFADICTKCGDSPTDCENVLMFAGFGDGGVGTGGTGTISSDGKTITGYYLDIGSGEHWSYQFTR